MNKTLRHTLIAVGTVIVLILALPFVVPLDVYRGRIESAATTATGRSFKIDGPLRLTLFPRFGVRAEQVTLANVPGGRAAVMVAVGEIDFSVKVVPLFRGRITLDKITLDQPAIALEVDQDGNPNWKFGKPTVARTGETKKAGTLTLPAGAELSGIAISDGRVTYDNAKTRTHRALDHVNVDVDITTADRPITATGDMTMADRKLTFAARLTTLKTFLGSGTTTFELSTDADLMHASLKGRMLPDGTLQGAVKLDSPSFRDLSGWFGTALPAGGLGALVLSSRIENKDKITTLSDLKVTLDGQTMKGSLTVDARAKVPYFEGALDIDRLDINPYLSGGKAEPKDSTQPKEAGWSKKPISLALLKTFNGKLALTTGSLHTQSLNLGRTVLRIDNDNGRFTAWIDQMSLYGGNGKAMLTLDTRGTVPQFANTLQFSGVQLHPFLKDALGLNSIEGIGAVNLDVRTAGASRDALLHSLAGKGSIKGANGRFKGVDLGAVAKTIKIALGSDATGTVAATSFDDMGANFVLVDGVLTTNDFHLSGPVVQMTGSGAIDIANQAIDFRIRPEAGGIGIPFRIQGSWSKLHYTADVTGIVGGVMDSLKNGGSALGKLFGTNKSQGDNGRQNGKKKNLGDRIKNMFGIH